jgi:hypothetical protein
VPLVGAAVFLFSYSFVLFRPTEEQNVSVAEHELENTRINQFSDLSLRHWHGEGEGLVVHQDR